jgi:hypothetical protein
MEQRPSFTPMPQVLQPGQPTPMVTGQPMVQPMVHQVVQQSSYVPPPVHMVQQQQQSPSYVPPVALGAPHPGTAPAQEGPPSITTLPGQPPAPQMLAMGPGGPGMPPMGLQPQPLGIGMPPIGSAMGLQPMHQPVIGLAGTMPGQLPAGMQPGMQPGMMQPGMQPGMMQPGMMQPGMMQPPLQPCMPQHGLAPPFAQAPAGMPAPVPPQGHGIVYGPDGMPVQEAGTMPGMLPQQQQQFHMPPMMGAPQ